MDATKQEIKQAQSDKMGQPTFTKQKRSRHIAIIGALVVIIAVVVAVILAVTLTRKQKKGNEKEKSEIKLQVLSITSYGLIGNSVRISANYRAPREHTTDWFIRYEASDTLRSAGDVRPPADDDVDSVVIASTTIQDFLDVTTLQLRIYSSYESVVIVFKVNELSHKGSENITEWRNEIIHIDNNILAPVNSNLTIGITLDVDEDILNLMDQESKTVEDLINNGADIFIDALNTTSEPPAVFEVVQGYPDKNFFPQLVSRDGSVVQFTISISVDHVQYGGLFTFRIRENSTNKYIDKITQGVTINILSPLTKAVVPQNYVGLYPFNKETYIFSKRGSLICFAMGNPRPLASLFKSGEDNNDILLSDMEETIRDQYTHMIAYTLERSNLEQEGTYKCRARSNQATSEFVTEVIFAELPVVDNAETGVIVNTTEQTIIQCKATGKPPPTFKINLFTDYGPDLTKTGLYQVNQSFPDGRTSVVTLTISPPDTALHTVFCVPVQQDIERYEMVTKIEVYQHDENMGIDWDIYNRMEDLVHGTTTNSPNNGR